MPCGTFNITGENISLDLNDVTITPESAVAIRVNNSNNVRIFNGTIAGGEGAGIAGSGMGSVSISDLQLLDITGDCIDLNNPSAILVVERIPCHGATRAGIFMRQGVADAPLHAVIRDNVIINVNTATNVSTNGIAVSHNTTGELNVVVTGNQVLNNRVFGLRVQGPGATASGQVTGNMVSGNGGPGIEVFSDVVVAKNVSAGNSPNYNVTSQQAAPITALDQNPGPWDNISE